jgi:hypothetical protein
MKNEFGLETGEEGGVGAGGGIVSGATSATGSAEFIMY